MTTPMDLAEYLARPGASADLLTPPPVSAPWPPQAWWSWQGVAEDDLDRGLERWSWGIAAYGRAACVTAALAVLDAVMPIWDSALAAAAPGTESVAPPAPAELRGLLAAWSAAPSDAIAQQLQALQQGPHLELFDHIGNPEFKATWNDSWMFTLLAAYAAAQLAFDAPEFAPRCLGNVVLAARRALAPRLGAAAPLAAWRLVAAAFPPPSGSPTRPSASW